jgi:predicted DCC family thiol-disulfide oxidoreductase YuxK
VRHPVLFYDGVCGLCNRMVQFVLRHDHRAIFRFASLQSSLAKRILERRGVRSADLDSMYVLADFDPETSAEMASTGAKTLLARGDAILFVTCQLGGIWRVLATVLACLPRGLREWGYAVIARKRYRWFGRYDACPLPSEETRERFLDL